MAMMICRVMIGMLGRVGYTCTVLYDITLLNVTRVHGQAKKKKKKKTENGHCMINMRFPQGVNGKMGCPHGSQARSVGRRESRKGVLGGQTIYLSIHRYLTVRIRIALAFSYLLIVHTYIFTIHTIAETRQV